VPDALHGPQIDAINSFGIDFPQCGHFSATLPLSCHRFLTTKASLRMRNCNPLRKPNSLPRSWGSEACGNKSISLPFNSVLMVRDERQSHPAPTARRCFTAIAHPVSLRSSKVLANDSLSRIVTVRSALRQTALQKPSQTFVVQVQISSRNSARTKIQRRPSLLFHLTRIPFCQRERRGRFRFITNLRLCTMLKNSGYLDQK
jgi:hypothetical protein